MGIQAVRKFLDEAASKPELRKRLDSALSGSADQQDALIAFAASEGYEFNASELVATARDPELSDRALDNVAGGVQDLQQQKMQAKELQQAEGRLGNFEIQRLMSSVGKAEMR
jgi:predicted ribosomally synthesized peptide with nif11-like leader